MLSIYGNTIRMYVQNVEECDTTEGSHTPDPAREPGTRHTFSLDTVPAVFVGRRAGPVEPDGPLRLTLLPEPQTHQSRLLDRYKSGLRGWSPSQKCSPPGGPAPPPPRDKWSLSGRPTPGGLRHWPRLRWEGGVTHLPPRHAHFSAPVMEVIVRSSVMKKLTDF